MSDQTTLPSAPGPGPAPDWERTLQAFQQIVATAVEADKHRADSETARYARQLESWDSEAQRAHRRFLVVAGMLFIPILATFGLAFYAYASGDAAVATHLIAAVLSFAAGFAAGRGVLRRQQ